MKGDLISRQAAIDALMKQDSNCGIDAARTIETLPSVDAVEVVRCKDCHFWEPMPSISATPEYHECKARPLIRLHTAAEEFCSRGQRKEDDWKPIF